MAFLLVELLMRPDTPEPTVWEQKLNGLVNEEDKQTFQTRL